MSARAHLPSSAGRSRARLLAVAAVLLGLVVPTALTASSATAAPERVAATGGCRAVGSSGAPSGGGPDRATVIVDTGSGPVWSACISFSGTISGIEALERAEAVITDLDPVYDQYTGLGRAVCRLRGVGTDPPDCLGKSVDSWWVTLNGRVTGVGAAGLQIRDGDVEGWRYASGGAAPRPATNGTEAAAAPVVTTTRPTAPVTQPPGGGTPSNGGSISGSANPGGSPSGPGATVPGQAPTTTKPGETTTAKGSTTTTAAADGDERAKVEAAAVDGGGSSDDDGASGESASAASSTDGGALASSSDEGGSSAPAVIGFVAVIAALAGGAYLVRRRRSAVAPPAA